MKYALLAILAIGLIFVGCKKKSTTTHCYACYTFDSLGRGGSWVVYPTGGVDTICNMTSGQLPFYYSQHVYYDSFYRGTDSMAYGYHTQKCEF